MIENIILLNVKMLSQNINYIFQQFSGTLKERT